MRKEKTFNVDTINYRAMSINDNVNFYSRDTDAFLVFNLTDTEFDFDEAIIYLVNSDDKSVITEIETKKITNGVEYEITPEIMAHYGRWKGQIVFQKDGEKASSAIFEFSINRFLTDERPPTLNEVESIAKLRRDAKELIAELSDTYDDLLANGVLQTNINNKLTELETQYSPKLTEVSAQLAQKANQAFVDSQLASIVSGAPKGTYTDLASLQNAYPNGTEGVFLVLENGHWYYWQATTSSWTDGGVYQGAETGDKTITPIKASFVNVGKNLFNKDDAVIGFTIHPTGGNLAPNTAYSTSDYIKVTAGESITQNQGWVTAFYGDNNILIPGSISPTSNPDAPRTITVPPGATKMRSAVSNAKKDTYQIERGLVATAYEPYELVYDYLRNTIRDREQDVKLEFQDLLNKYNLKYFTLYNENSASGQPLETKLKIYSAFAFIKITGSDADKPHHIRYLARNHADVGYRMIIERKDDTGWVQIIDTGTLRLTENEFGPTILKYSNASYGLEAHIDYRLFPASQWSGSLGNIRTDGQFILQKNAFGVVVENSGGGGGGEAYDQRLNTTDNVTFNSVSSNSVNTDAMAIGGTLPNGTISSPPTGLLSGDVWVDTTDSSTHPILRVKL